MTPSETLFGWLAGAGRWLWANHVEVGALAGGAFGIGWYLKWNHSVRPEPADPHDLPAWKRWRRNEAFAFAVWHRSGLVPKWLVEASPLDAPPSRPPWERAAKPPPGPS